VIVYLHGHMQQSSLIQVYRLITNISTALLLVRVLLEAQVLEWVQVLEWAQVQEWAQVLEWAWV